MDSNLINQLEKQIEVLLQSYDKLKQDNASLREKLANLSNERNIIKEKQDKAAVTLEALISKVQNFVGTQNDAT